MHPKDKILVALDVPELEKALRSVSQLAPYVGGFKVGLELLTSEGAPRVVKAVQEKGGKVFFDGKFKDIPNTVAAASRAVGAMGVRMFNVHALGGLEMMRAAATAAAEGAASAGVDRPISLAVTILTSMDVATLDQIGFKDVRGQGDIQNIVVSLARLAKEAGIDGVVASPKEITAIREACGTDFLIVTPGVRPAWAATGDQKRVMTPHDAVAAGADFMVIGRPILKPPAEVGSPVDAAKRIVEEIKGA